MVNEASHALSGFGTYGKELLTRLFESNKYHIAEFASYAYIGDSRDGNVKWRFYPNAVLKDDPRFADYNSKIRHKFGEWRFESVLLDFKPDIVFDIRDPWMLSYESTSPLRPYFHWAIMPTVDSAPQRTRWMTTFLDADAVFTYSEWALKVLRQQSSKLKLQRTAPPGVNPDVYKPVANKAEHKKSMNLPPDSYIFGTVMRNQVRKLYPDLFQAFRIFLDTAPKEIANKTYLYVHTSYPDKGWEIPELLQEFELGNKVFFTYICRATNEPYCIPFQGARTYSPLSNAATGTLPNVSVGLTQEQMVKVYNAFDAYIQYSICLTKNQEVLTYTGWQPISKIKVGEQVYTHNNIWQQVTKTFQNPNQHNLKEISVCGDYEKLEITNNHPTYCYTKETLQSDDKQRSVREILGTRIYGNTKNIPNPSFIPVMKLAKGDLIVSPIDDTVSWVDYQSITHYMSNKDNINLDGTIKVYHDNNYNNQIKIDEDFCRFLGLFVADGSSLASTHSREIKITCHESEDNNIQLATLILDTLSNNNSKIVVYPNKHAIDIRLYSRLHASVFTDWCYTKDKSKKLPSWCLTLPTNLQKNIIHGLCMGDGCYSKNITIYVTTSKVLAEQLKTLLRRCRLYYNVNIIYKHGNRKPQYRFEIPGNVKNGQFDKAQKRNNSCSLYYNNMLLLKIKDIKDIKNQSEYVYNIEVNKDNSYVTRIGCVHNCEGFGMPQVEAAACKVPVMAVNYSAMVDVIQKTNGIPLKVQRYFKDLDTGAYRALPDNEFCAKKMLEFIVSMDREAMGNDARRAVKDTYNWNKTANIWMDYFDSVTLTDKQGKWQSPPQMCQIPKSMPSELSNTQFVKWLFHNVIYEPHKDSGSHALEILRDLNYGVALKGGELVEVKREDIFKQFCGYAQNKNICEKSRFANLDQPDFIKYAHMKEQSGKR